MDTKVIKKIYENSHAVIYLAKYANYASDVVLKVLKDKHPTENQLLKFYNEYNYTKNIEIKGVRKVIDKIKFENKHALVLEYFNGKSLKDYSTELKILPNFLEFAINLSEVLGNIHSKNIVHKDINNRNILVNAQYEIKIIDFGLSSKHEVLLDDKHINEHLEGSLQYISPEQTGRMNRYVDYRTDLYSAGIVFYELLTGKLPFEYSDTMKLIHAHIAETPKPPKELNPQIPKILSDIILKLISKNAENRYQSAFGLKYDLQKVRESINNSNLGFELGKKDFSGKLTISDKVYGREIELELLKNAFNRIKNGTSELFVVSGRSGVGKSVFVNQIYTNVIESNGYYLYGKYEKFNKNIPYSALIDAFNVFIDKVLLGSDEQLKYWKKIILKNVGSVGKVLTNLLPRMELIIGKQPELPNIDEEEAKNRFNYVFINFVKAIANAKHPVVLFLDNTHRADTASLDLLQLLLKDLEINYLLCIFSYNSEPQKKSNYFLDFLEKCNDLHLNVNNISLKPLSKKDLKQQIQDTLKQPNEKDTSRYDELVDLIHSKTAGNSFFSTQLLDSLYKQKLLLFDFNENLWKWDTKKIKEQNISDNVVGLLTQKAKELPPETLEVLKKASCIGKDFKLPILKKITEIEDEKLVILLETAIAEKFILTSNFIEFSFVDTRIQQVIYKEVSDKEKSETHYQIGKIILESDEAEENIFSLVNHLNLGISKISGADNIQKLRKLNLEVTKKAKENAAYESAFNYCQNAEKLLPQNAQDKDYDDYLKIKTELALLSYLNVDYEKSRKYIKEIIYNAKVFSNKIDAYIIQINIYRAKSEYSKAVELGLRIVEKLGIKSFRRINKLTLIRLYIAVQLKLSKYTPEKILKLPPIKNNKISSATRVMDAIGSSAYLAMPDLTPLLILKRILLILKYGNDKQGAAYTFATYGIILNVMKKPEKALTYGKLALDLYQKLKSEASFSKIKFVVNFNIYPWKKRIHDFYKNFLEAFQKGKEIGDLEFTAYSLSSYRFMQNVLGTNLKKMHRNSIADLDDLQKLNQEVSIKRQYIYLDFYERMIFSKPKKIYFDPKTEVVKLKEANDRSTLAYYYIYNAIFLYLLDNHEEAYKNLKEAEKYKDGIKANYLISLHNFYYSLSILSIIENKPKEEQKELLAQIEKNQKQMKDWYKQCESNFLHKFYLVEAEKLNYLNKHETARTIYEKAIEFSQKNDFLNEEALAWERAAVFFLKLKNIHLAQFYLQKTYSSYKAWGADAKLELLEKKYSDHIYNPAKDNVSSQSNYDSTSSTYYTGNTNILDVGTIIKASQSLSGEVKLSNLLKNMLAILIENAGAQKGIIINNENGIFKIEAISNLGQETIIKTMELDNFEQIPVTIVKYVIRTQKPLIIDNALKDTNYSTNDYISKNKVKSIFCHPVIQKGKTSAIIYLENSLSSNAFTSNRIEIVNMLSAQIAISLENATLYQNLEQKVEERTKKLSEANKHITDSIIYAKRIQNAILPPQNVISNICSDSFILYKPRDIVSGDFYWATEMNGSGIIAAADCTGHGVPGAFLSMLGISLLDKIVSEAKEVNPAQILNSLRSEVKKSLNQNIEVADSSKDGMDIALIYYDKQKNEIIFAGAYNPLYIVRQKTAKVVTNNKNRIYENSEIPEKLILEYKADKMPIGSHIIKEKQFTQHTIKICKNDKFYIFSDGYADQFGGKSKRKFLAKNFKKKLLEISDKQMSEQKQILEKTINDWILGTKQLDDILVIGLEF